MSKTGTTRGLSLPCPKCSESDVCIMLHLDDMKTFTCAACEEEFTAEDIANIVNRWTPILKWIETAP